ncbi:helix-turn-helix transcriptional regulator [Chelativorans salis]|uniref:AraC family transcriptional regulator n=1 Tax=Chelativorans salis TaxID=2978478 RepID=A0ABT2LHU4_9HYPH|nr:AraC family transcriptional regulator [Chelativorans sp. EGI FJ00035]MCT7373922.1 AraC family transcriptional regulator [Chelativorans sp. EGI FJ00035]
MSTDAPEVAAFCYTRDDILSPKGLERWRDLMGRAVLGLDLKLISEQSFHSRVETWFLPDVRITFASKSGLCMMRSRALLEDGADDISLHICTDGEWAIEHRNKEAPLHPGEAALVSDAEVASVTCASSARCVCIQIARSRLAPLVPDLNDALMRPIRRDNEALQLILGYVDMLRAGPSLRSPVLREMAASHIRDLVAAALGVSREGAAIAASGGVRAARRSAMKADIDRHIEEPDLSVSTVAARHGISPRYVQALFEDEGMTFSSFVLARRLARAHRLLVSPRHHPRRIADIAFDVGFGDLSYFNRAFRRRYGLTPSDVRALAFLPAAAPRT